MCVMSPDLVIGVGHFDTPQSALGYRGESASVLELAASRPSQLQYRAECQEVS